MKPLVLIAEDDIILTRVLETKFKINRDRFDVLFAYDADDAIEILKTRPVSLLVTDLQMPNTEGFRLLAYMSEHHPEVPCLVLSLGDLPQTPAPVAEDGVISISKPVDAQVLERAIIQVLARGIPRGTSHGISVVSFLQMLAMERKTCLFDIELHDGGRGRFYFDSGVLLNAVCGDLRKEEAALALMCASAGRFRFRYVPENVIPRQIKTDLHHLIVEAKHCVGLPPIRIAS